MDASLPLAKNQRHFGSSLGFCDNVDRISRLPDEVISQILSYLPTKDAVATSILSKRWEYLWTSASNLDFSDQFRFDHSNENDYITKMRAFKDFVDRVFFYHGGSVIRKCLFLCCNNPNLYSWICAVITCNVQELTIECSFFNLQQLPWMLFTCKTLVVLKISGRFVLDFPTYISLPLLKVMCLEGVVCVDDASMERFFSCCPVLEDLSISRLEGDAARIMKISTPLLKILTIHPNVRCIGYENHPPELTTLFILQYLNRDRGSRWELNVMSSLVEARIYGECDLGLLYGISQVKHLVLTGKVMEEMRFIARDYALPTFNNLKKLELHVGKTVNWELLPSLLECSPNLEVLVFPKGLMVPKKGGRDYYGFYWHRPESVPECLPCHLKMIEIFNFVGLPGELYLVEYLLECGKVLDRMTIHCYDFSARPRMQKEMEEVIDEVLNFERSSSTCEVIFIA